MFNWKVFEKTKVVLSQHRTYQDKAGQHHVTIRPVELLRWMEVSREDLGFIILADIACVDLAEVKGSYYEFELTYQLLNMGTHQRLNIHVRFDQDEIVPSVVDIFAHAEWLEREQQEAFNIKFSKKHEPLLLPKGQTIWPLRKKSEIKDWPLEGTRPLPAIRRNPNKSEAPYPEEAHVWKRFDLLSTETLGNFEWLVRFDPEKVVGAEVNIGFHHQGLEKLFEKKDWQQVLQLADKVQLGAAPTYSIALAKNLEDLLRIKLPERAQAIRIVALELARIAEHLTVMQETTYSLEMDEHRLFVNAREKIYELMERFCGRRQGLGIVRIGGLREDLPHGWIVEYQSVFEILSRNLKTIHRSLISQRNFRDSLSSGEVDAQAVLHWGLSGPSMRASGLNFDLRKSQPFYFYQDIDFDIPVGIHGTAYDRYLIRYEEIFQSFRIITQVIDNLPLGEIINPEYDKGYGELKEHLAKQELPAGWHYTALESPNGEAGFSVMFYDPHTPYRVKIKTPSFGLSQALPHLALGNRSEQLKPFLASLGIRRNELDR